MLDEKGLARLAAGDLAVPTEVARRQALFDVYASVASRTRGFDGWERAQLPRRPTVIYDLSGLPLFYDYPVRLARAVAGFVRVAANKALGDSVIAVQMTPPAWRLDEAHDQLRKHVRRASRGATVEGTRLVCYSYPKVALETELTTARGRRRILVDVGDLSLVEIEGDGQEAESGQVASSLLAGIPSRTVRRRATNWDRADAAFAELTQERPALDPDRIADVPVRTRLEAIDLDLGRWELIPAYTEKTIDFCCHSGGCRDHECFCLHPQENSVHCTRASSQMLLCFYRYCFSQHQIAQAFGVADDVGTPWSAVEDGLEDLTNNCFDATLDYSVSFGDYKSEIDARRPCLSDTGGHTRACAGYRQWNIWWLGKPRPRSISIFDPWPPNTGAVYWENFNTTGYAWVGNLVRRTTPHT